MENVTFELFAVMALFFAVLIGGVVWLVLDFAKRG